jgi:hypothetical protein
MNPLGLRSAQVLAARSGRTRRVKTPPIALSKRLPSAYRSISTHDCGDVFGYAKFTPIGPGQRHARAMQYEVLFIFQKDIRAGIEYRV